MTWWLHALGLWNRQDTELKVKHKDVWAIPKKGTEAMREVRELGGKEKKKEEPKPEPKKEEPKPKRKLKTTMKINLDEPKPEPKPVIKKEEPKKEEPKKEEKSKELQELDDEIQELKKQLRTPEVIKLENRIKELRSTIPKNQRRLTMARPTRDPEHQETADLMSVLSSMIYKIQLETRDKLDKKIRDYNKQLRKDRREEKELMKKEPEKEEQIITEYKKDWFNSKEVKKYEDLKKLINENVFHISQYGLRGDQREHTESIQELEEKIKALQKEIKELSDKRLGTKFGSEKQKEIDNRRQQIDTEIKPLYQKLHYQEKFIPTNMVKFLIYFDVKNFEKINNILKEHPEYKDLQDILKKQMEENNERKRKLSKIAGILNVTPKKLDFEFYRIKI